MSVRFKMDWIPFALVKSKICELNLFLCEEHEPVLVTLQFPCGKQAPYEHHSALLCGIPEL